MMKKSISWMVFLLLMTAACAQAAPQLTNVTADGESLHAGEGWTVSFETTEGGPNGTNWCVKLVCTRWVDRALKSA